MFTNKDKTKFVIIAETEEEWEQLKQSGGAESLIARHYFDAQTIYGAAFVNVNCAIVEELR